MTFHLVSLPHTQVTRDWDACAYTAKVRRLVGMLRDTGRDVILYAGEQCEAEPTEHVTVVTEADHRSWWGGPWPRGQVFDQWDASARCWREMNAAAISAVKRRAQPGDTLGIIAGICQQQLADGLPRLRAVEWGIGYSGVFAKFRVFESHAWRHHVAGLRAAHGIEPDDLRWCDEVIPNAYDPADFRPAAAESKGYLLFIGRPTQRKGLDVIRDIAARTAFPILHAGQGDPGIPGVEHVGLVTGKAKADLLFGARAVLAPTTYLEPFGGVAVEAQMAGAPAITTDWGAFTETVSHGYSGFRCRTLRDFLDAIEQAGQLDRAAIQENARHHWSTHEIAWRYDAYLNRLAELDGDGWYAA